MGGSCSKCCSCCKNPAKPWTEYSKGDEGFYSYEGDQTLLWHQGCGVWGTGPFTADSRIVPAAIYLGLLTADGKGVIKVEKAPGQASYEGGTQNGITTKKYGSYDASIIITKPFF